MKPVFVAVGALALGLAIAAFLTRAQAPRQGWDNSQAMGQLQRIEPPVAILDVALVDGAGRPADLSAYRGKALLVNFWATWCPPCIAELPSLARLQQLKGSADFAVLPIAIDERDPAKVSAFLESRGIDLPALIDTKRAIDRVLRVGALPTSLLVDPDGMARAVFVGDNKWDCGAPFKAIEDFVATGEISADLLLPCSEN